MMITRDNYEPFFLDYLEGSLGEDTIDQFLDFLEQNPDLKEELQLFENIHLPEELVVYPGKAHLYKSVQEEKSAFEIKSVAFLEGDLNNEELKSFETYLSTRPELQKEYNLFAKTRLVADTGIKYPHKRKLYRKSGTAIALNWAARIAAVVAVLWGISSLFQTENQIVSPTNIQEIASVRPKQEINEKKQESDNTFQKTEIVKNAAGKTNPKPRNIQKRTIVTPEIQPTANVISQERDFSVPEKITPIPVRLEPELAENRLAVSRSINVQKINDPRNVMTIEEFLASRAKKVGNEGLLSVQRIFRTGLNVVSELSGEHIGYQVNNGKVSSIGFESKLLAFSIPLKKK